jgi:hypothetical protein
VRIRGEEYYYYKVAAASGLIACAVRSHGVVAMPFPLQSSGIVNSMGIPGLDIVDVCPLDATSTSDAFVALAFDGTFMIMPDMMQQRAPLVFKFPGIGGTAYRVLSIAGSIFVLTSDALYALVGLAERYLRGETIRKQRTLVRSTPLEGVDVNIVYNQYLFVVEPNDVLAIEIAEFARERVEQGPEAEQAPEMIDAEPSWDRHGIESDEQSLAVSPG